MKKYFAAAFGFVLLAVLIGAPQEAKSQEKTVGSRTLQVKVHYTGSGTVDANHKIFVVLWDTPDFMKGGEVMPMSLQPTAAKDGTVTFSDVSKSPVYVSAAYDPSGSWDGQSGPPPSGTSLGLYSKTPGTPEPIDIQPGKTAKVELTFNDTIKMP